MNVLASAAAAPFGGQALPLASAPGTAAGSGTGSAPSNQLDANSFITLLTAQLQAQDPLNPLDPNQMVSELTAMNTLQQIIQIREDMDAMLKGAQSGSSLGPAVPPASRNGASAAALSGLGTNSRL